MAVVVVSKIQKKGWLTVDCSGGWWRDDGFGGSGFAKWWLRPGVCDEG